MNREELAWAAGFFDGEGHIGIAINNKKTQNKRITVQVCQTEDGPLERFREALGMGKIYGPYNPSRGASNRRPYKQYHLERLEHIQKAMELLWPWLSVPKKTQAEKVFAEFNEYLKLPKATRGPNKKPRMVAKCHPDRPHVARSMCNACYLQFLHKGVLPNVQE